MQCRKAVKKTLICLPMFFQLDISLGAIIAQKTGGRRTTAFAKVQTLIKLKARYLNIFTSSGRKSIFFLFLTPLEPSSRKGWALRVSGLAREMPTTVMKPRALAVAILSQRRRVLDSCQIKKVPFKRERILKKARSFVGMSRRDSDFQPLFPRLMCSPPPQWRHCPKEGSKQRKSSKNEESLKKRKISFCLSPSSPTTLVKALFFIQVKAEPSLWKKASFSSPFLMGPVSFSFLALTRW